MEKQINIAIDGPAGAGKSTVAKMVAEKLNFIYIDTGAMYRALTYAALNTSVDINNEEEVLQLLHKSNIELSNNDGVQRIFLNGKDISDAIRSTDVTNRVSYVAKHRQIREQMVTEQQALAVNGGTVMDGRDIGTAVLPSAEVKVFLTASVEERARRRHEEHLSKGQSSDYDTLVKEIRNRDKIDSERETAPLRKALDAIEIDSTSMTIPEVVEHILQLVKERV
ncbi:(d)CMP kinase [Bacillus shivajii]|uniref:(d)CMP kinase n=1 Tax=Bacillus shivajii TaxID=1983719 RepID=UPI001CFA8CE9|nr:(d)CMP kinase [Bacillus shivajii]UCZ54753.1 (d)CMP kinase [Bacillus shivajii]